VRGAKTKRDPSPASRVQDDGAWWDDARGEGRHQRRPSEKAGGRYNFNGNAGVATIAPHSQEWLCHAMESDGLKKTGSSRWIGSSQSLLLLLGER